jgi:hypothetical protein
MSLPRRSTSIALSAAIAGIALLGAASVSLIALDTGGGAVVAAAPDSAPAPSQFAGASLAQADAAGAAAPLVASTPAPSPLAAPPTSATQPTPVRRPPSPQQIQRSAAPAITRLMPSRARTMINFAIQQQAPKLASCFKRNASLGAARQVPASRRSMIGANTLGVLRLELEPQQGELWIVDAAVEQGGKATNAELACAQRALRGAVLEMPGTTPGPRVAMEYPIP